MAAQVCKYFKTLTSRFKICLHHGENIVKHIEYLGIMTVEKYLGVGSIEAI